MSATRCAVPIAIALLLLTSGLAADPPANPSFTDPPKATTMPDGRINITFAVSAETDMAVAIVTADGPGSAQPGAAVLRIVRHLAAGRLGKNAPALLVADSLRQELVWDGRDDDGRAVGGKFTVQVSLGLKPGKVEAVGWNPKATGMLHGLAVGPNGSLYVLCEPGRDTHDARVMLFDAAGKYLRTLVPRLASCGRREMCYTVS